MFKGWTTKDVQRVGTKRRKRFGAVVMASHRMVSFTNSIQCLRGRIGSDGGSFKGHVATVHESLAPDQLERSLEYITYCLILSKSSSPRSLVASHICSNSTSSALSPPLPLSGLGGGNIFPNADPTGTLSSEAARDSPPESFTELLASVALRVESGRVEGDAGVNGDEDDGEGLVAMDGNADRGWSGGMGRIQIRSRSRLCYDTVSYMWTSDVKRELTRSRSSSMRRRMSFRENVSSLDRFRGDSPPLR